MSVLADSSVWIDYFRNEENTLLDKLISEDLVVTNEVILTELIPAFDLQNQKEVTKSLENLEVVPLSIDWMLIRKYQILILKNGINKVGIPDLLIIQQVIESNSTLYSFNKHFILMNQFLNFESIHG
ncbi:MAG TPA: PIN domain-containing protein [Cyclobacteriaceae bacterium]